MFNTRLEPHMLHSHHTLTLRTTGFQVGLKVSANFRTADGAQAIKAASTQKRSSEILRAQPWSQALTPKPSSLTRVASLGNCTPKGQS